MKTKSKQQLKEENILLQRKVDRLREDKDTFNEFLDEMFEALIFVLMVVVTVFVYVFI